MCGRYALDNPDAAPVRFKVSDIVEQLELRPNYNVAPSQTLPVIVRHSPNALEFMRWGLIPPWAKDSSVGNRMINARAETVATKPAYRRAFRTQRCLVPASGFFEWQKLPRDKQPYYFRLSSGDLFAFAGLWESWRSPEGETLHSYTIITTEANDLLAPVHNRMPVILREADEDTWLDPDLSEPEHLLPLLAPYPAELMQATAVSALVNSPRNNSPAILQPVSEHAEPSAD